MLKENQLLNISPFLHIIMSAYIVTDSYSYEASIVKRQGGEETESGTATKKNPRSKPISMTFPGQ